MCTMIAEQIHIQGSGKGAAGWFTLREAGVSYDHPFHVALDHALNIDFVDESQGPGARVAVELSVASARALVQTIQEVLDRAAAGGYLEEEDASRPAGSASGSVTSPAIASAVTSR